MSVTVEQAQSMAYADATTRSRNSAVMAFARFCVFTGYAFLPASTMTLCEYAVYLHDNNVKASSISTYISHIGTFHKLKGLDDPTKSFALSTTVRGLARLQDCRPNSKAPLTPVELVKIRATLDWSSSLHRTFWACLVVGFWTYLRCSNLVPRSERAFDPLKQVSPDNLSLSDEGLIIALQRTKTIQFNERQLLIPLVRMGDNPLCPIQAIRDMWALCRPQNGTPLFSFTSPSGLVRPLVHSHLNKSESRIRGFPAIFLRL